MKFTYVDDYDFLAAHKIEESIPWAMLRGNDDGMMSVKNDRAIAAGLDVSPAGDDGARHARLVAHRPRGAPAEAALLDHAGEGSAGARRLARSREVAAQREKDPVTRTPPDLIGATTSPPMRKRSSFDWRCVCA